MKHLILSILAAIALSCNRINPLEDIKIPLEHEQIVLVTTESWNDSTGSLQLFARKDRVWKSWGPKINVVVGRNGLAWGRGLHEPVQEPVEKEEGDGKAPAGIFRLSGAFGYGEKPPADLNFSYRQATSRDYWIDDVNAPEYNQWVTIPDTAENVPTLYWDSFEQMRREDPLYEYGIVVDHNTQPVEKRKGSAIFMHVWRGDGTPTAGCTAMPRHELLKVLQWLDKEKNPVLIQIPVDELDQLKFMD